jgi:hypothetical protein
MTVWKGFREQLLYSDLKCVQVLASAVYPKRKNCCQRFFQQTANPLFVSSMLITDEATFGRDGIGNFDNQHQWA